MLVSPSQLYRIPISSPVYVDTIDGLKNKRFSEHLTWAFSHPLYCKLCFWVDALHCIHRCLVHVFYSPSESSSAVVIRTSKP